MTTCCGVIPAYNAAAFITDAINSLRQQTVVLDEIIVVDDGSTDNTRALAERTGVRVLHQANRGPAAARNAAIRATNAEWIVLLDADDVAYPERVATQLPLLDDPSVAVIGTRDEKTRGPAITHEFLWKNNPLQTSTVFLRRSAWESVGGFNESRDLICVEDYNLWLRLTHHGWKVIGLDQPLARSANNPHSLSAQLDRFIAAELENARVLGAEFQLSATAVRAKQHDVLLEYGYDMFHDRRFGDARRFFRHARRYGDLSWSSSLRLWLTHVPTFAKLIP